MRSRALLFLLGLLSTVALPFSAQGQSIIKTPFGGQRPYQLDVHGGFAYVGRGLAAGARFGVPIVHNGFVRSINNSVYINFGADLYFVDYEDSHSVGIGIPVTLHWEFYFTPKWSAFGEAGPNFFLAPAFFKGDGWAWSGEHWVTFAAGGRYFLNDALALTLRLGNPYSSFGVSFFF